MDIQLLENHIQKYAKRLEQTPEKYREDMEIRLDRVSFYQSWSRDRLLGMSEEDFYEYIADLVWGDQPIDERWDTSRSQVKGMGPAMMSEKRVDREAFWLSRSSI